MSVKEEFGFRKNCYDKLRDLLCADVINHECFRLLTLPHG